ncbi:serine pats1 threonine-protein kinase, partial [Mytilus galloprovincialis]
MYDKVFFINATNASDLVIGRLTDTLVDIAYQQSTWGQQMPIVWVPLDLQISDMRADGVKLITKEKVLDINRSNKEFSLSEKRVEDFLLVQNSIGKILYFDEPALRDFIVIQPSAMVNILRAFITDRMFWPKKGLLRDILEKLSATGVLQKTDLFTLWSQRAFKELLGNDRIKDYVVQVLLHLDILVEPKRYNEMDTAADLFLVPCIVTSNIPRKIQIAATDDKTICIAYHLKETVVPSALSFKLIGAAICIWPLKKVDSRFCLYFQAAVMDADSENIIHIHVEGQRIYAYLINDKSKELISPDLATTTQECLTLALERILQFYHRAICKQNFQIMSDLFEIEVGEICNGETCLIPLLDAQKRKHWSCKNGKKHETKYPLNWVFDKNKEHCDPNCEGLEKETKTLLLKPTDQHFVHLTKYLGIGDFYNFFIHLGMTKTDYDNLNFRYFSNPMDMMLMGMFQWRDKTESDQSPATFGKLLEALKAIGRQHYLCQGG